MAQPVWVLSVDLQTKTATFMSGMGEAARGARSAFTDIRNSAKEGGEGVERSATNVRAALGLIDNTIRGNHAAAMADLVREFQDSRIVMMALPFAATIGGIGAVAAIAVEVAAKIKEWREEHEKLTLEATRFGTAINESFNGLDGKILTAEQRFDELRNDHIGALHKQLELINHASMAELVHELETIAKAADTVFKGLEGHWYTLGIGSAGASHALETFKTKYDSLLAQGKDKDAGDLLKGTRDSAERVLEAQRAMKGSVQDGGAFGKSVDYSAQYKARNELAKAGLGYAEKEVQAQEALVQALNAQVTASAKIAELKNLDSGNAARQTANEESSRRSEAARQANASMLAMGEQAIAADRATAAAQLEIQRATIGARLENDLAFAQREYDVRLAANQQEIAALDKAGKDYQNQLKAQQNKALELSQQHETQIAELRSRAAIEQNKKDLTDLEQSVREKLNTTQQGSAERLALVDAAIKDEQSRNLQDTAFYRELQQQRVELVRKVAEDEAKTRADAGKEAADHEEKMGELAVAAQREQTALRESARRASDQRRMAEALQIANEEYALKLTALAQQIAALDKGGKDYENKLRQLQDKQKQLIRQHENEVTDIKDKAEMARNQRVLSAEQRFQDTIAGGLTQSMMRHQTFASAFINIGNQVVAGMMQNAIQSVMANDFTKESDAAAAARKAYIAGMHFPFPANIVMGPALGALAFASVMAFQDGTDAVPGTGRGDRIPAMLEPGEGVVPGGVMDGLRTMARSGNMGGGNHYHAHVSPTYNLQALDTAGMDKMLDKHHGALQKHVEKTMRKLNG